MSTQPYTPPVSQLLTYGGEEVANAEEWPDYLALGFGPEDIPELIRMATDADFQREESSELEFFASLHAARALAQLKAEAAIEPLLAFMSTAPDNEWFREEMPKIYAMIGPVAIPALSTFLSETNHEVFDRGYAASALAEIARQHPEARSQAVAALTQQLAQFEQNDKELNAFLIEELAQLKEVEALPLIKQAYEVDKVESFYIDLDYVLVLMGLKEQEKRDIDPNALFASPAAHASSMPDQARSQLAPSATSPLPPSTAYIKRAAHAGNADRKEKNKRKMAKQARKKNKRKK
jgi:hypothetical protein